VSHWLGSEIEAWNVHGGTPLQVAAQEGQVEAMKLLAGGARRWRRRMYMEGRRCMEAKDDHGGTPLHLAAATGKVEAMKLLAGGARR